MHVDWLIYEKRFSIQTSKKVFDQRLVKSSDKFQTKKKISNKKYILKKSELNVYL